MVFKERIGEYEIIRHENEKIIKTNFVDFLHTVNTCIGFNVLNKRIAP